MCAKHLILAILFGTLFDKQHYALLDDVVSCYKAMLGNSNWENGVVVLCWCKCPLRAKRSGFENCPGFQNNKSKLDNYIYIPLQVIFYIYI